MSQAATQTQTQTQTLTPHPSAPRQILTTDTTTDTAAAAAAAASSPAPCTPTRPLASFNYYLPLAQPSPAAKPSTGHLELILGSKNQDTRRLPVHDLRGRFDAFALDRCGFEVVVLDRVEEDMLAPGVSVVPAVPVVGTEGSRVGVGVGVGVKAKVKGWEDDEWIRCVYYPVMEGVVRRLYPDLKKILHLGHILRGALPRTDFTGPTDPAWNRPCRACAPATRAHIDFTHRGVRLVLAQEFDDSTAARVCDSGRRFVALSLWKPLKTVRRDPLGFCDGRTVDKEDQVVLDRVYPDGKEGENVVIKARREERGVHDWYWISAQGVEECVALKLFDSEEAEGRCTQTPHASFTLEGSEEIEEVRESVEVRVVVCF